MSHSLLNGLEKKAPTQTSLKERVGLTLILAQKWQLNHLKKHNFLIIYNVSSFPTKTELR